MNVPDCLRPELNLIVWFFDAVTVCSMAPSKLQLTLSPGWMRTVRSS